MSVGQFVFMLHSHLPYYRKAGMWPFGEENLYECMAETYVPLLNAIAELYEEGIKAKLTVGITPILAEQLNDEHLQNGFVEYIDSLSSSHSGLYCIRSGLTGSKFTLEYNTGGNIVLLSVDSRDGVFLGIAPDLVVAIVVVISGKACK